VKLFTLLTFSLFAAAATPDATATLNRVPLAFETNMGQFPKEVRYFGRGLNYNLALTRNEAWFSPAGGSQSVRMSLVGGKTDPAVEALQRIAGRTNYLNGSDPSKWRTDVANFGKIAWREVYPGVDLVFYGKQKMLEYDFIVKPGAEVSRIRMRFEGAGAMSIDANGDLLMRTKEGEIRQPKPVVYQSIGNRIEGRYVLEGNEVGFEIGEYDKTRELVIDPYFTYLSFLGGNSLDWVDDIAVDAAGNAYVIGKTHSMAGFPLAAPFQSALSSTGDFQSNLSDAFVTKISPSGALVYSTYFGCGGNTRAFTIAVDSTSNVYIAGRSSCQLPGPAPITAASGWGFVSKLNALGNAVLYNTRIGGITYQVAKVAAALDSSNRLHLTGKTDDSNFPLVNGTSYGGLGNGDAFYVRVSAAGAVINSFRFGGTDEDNGRDIAITPDGVPWITGYSKSSSFPNLAGFPVGGQDAFIARVYFGRGFPSIGFSRFLGGSGTDSGEGIAIGPDSSIYVAGSTNSSNFVLLPNPPPVPPTPKNSFLVKLNSAGSPLKSKYIADGNGGIAVNSSGTVAVVGLGGFTITRCDTQLNVIGQPQSVYIGTFSELAFPTNAKIALDGNGFAYVGGTFGLTGVVPKSETRV